MIVRVPIRNRFFRPGRFCRDTDTEDTDTESVLTIQSVVFIHILYIGRSQTKDRPESILRHVCDGLPFRLRCLRGATAASFLALCREVPDPRRGCVRELRIESPTLDETPRVSSFLGATTTGASCTTRSPKSSRLISFLH